MQKKHIGIVIATLAFLASVTHAWESEWLIEEAYGNLRGYTQTPKGGNYNTSSEDRPSYEEMGILQDPFLHAKATLYNKHFLAYFEYFRLRPHNDTILAHDLLTHSKFIPAGSPFEMSVHYNWYQLGIGFDSGEYFKHWFMEFSVAANWLKYIYHFSSPFAISARDFNLLAASLGLKVERCLGNNWLFDASAEVSLPLSRLYLINGSAGLSYSFVLNNSILVRPRLSVGGLYLDYEDTQKIPNHLRYQSTPYAALGLTFLFS